MKGRRAKRWLSVVPTSDLLSVPVVPCRSLHPFRSLLYQRPAFCTRRAWSVLAPLPPATCFLCPPCLVGPFTLSKGCLGPEDSDLQTATKDQLQQSSDLQFNAEKKMGDAYGVVIKQARTGAARQGTCNFLDPSRTLLERCLEKEAAKSCRVWVDDRCAVANAHRQ